MALIFDPVFGGIRQRDTTVLTPAQLTEIATQVPTVLTPSQLTEIATQVPVDNLLSVIAGGGIAAHRIVAIDTSGKAVHANAQNPAHAKYVLGIATTSCSVDESLNVQNSGKITDSGWSFAAGVPLFLGVNSLLSQVPPTSGFVKFMGYSVAPTEIILDIQPSITLIN